MAILIYRYFIFEQEFCCRLQTKRFLSLRLTFTHRNPVIVIIVHCQSIVIFPMCGTGVTMAHNKLIKVFFSKLLAVLYLSACLFNVTEGKHRISYTF